jgi:hypothetical protein
MSNPDGTYEIDGVPPGQYYVYVTPLPPGAEGSNPGDVFPPQDRNHQPFPATTNFSAQFFNGGNGTRDWTQAAQIGVSAGAANENINFSSSAVMGHDLWDGDIRLPALTTPMFRRATAGGDNRERDEFLCARHFRTRKARSHPNRKSA